RGALLCIRAALPSMRARGGGHIISISSIAAAGAHPGVVPYSAAKAALEQLSLGLAAELAVERVAVVVLKPPGTVATSGLRVLLGEQAVAGADPPEYMAEAAVLLASQPPDACSGRVFTDEQALEAFGRHDLVDRMRSAGG